MRNWCYSQAFFVLSHIRAVPLSTNPFCWQHKSETVDARFRRQPVDPDILSYWRAWIESVGSVIREQARLDDWVRLAAVCNVPLGMSYVELDMFWMEAITQAVNAYAKDQNQSQKEMMEGMTKKIEELKPSQSLLAGNPRPSFIQH